MRATVCRPGELGISELDEWRRMQCDAPALRHPFLTPEFALAIGDSTASARVAVIEEDGAHVAFLPFNHSALGGARPIGGRLNYRQGLVHADGFEWTWPELMRAAGVHCLEFTDLLGAQAPFGTAFARNPSPIIDTSVGWDAYIRQARRHGQIRKTLKRARRLERDLGPLQFTWGRVATEEYAQLIAWKSLQYRRSGWPDPFARGWIRDALDRLVDRGGGDLEVVFTTLRTGTELLAADMSLISHGVFAAWFSSYNQAFASYSPGAVRRMNTIQRACDDHLAYVDLARGDETYKQEFKNADLPVATGVLRDHSAPALLSRSVRTPYQGTRSWILRRPRTRAFVRSSLRHLGALRVRARPA